MDEISMLKAARPAPPPDEERMLQAARARFTAATGATAATAATGATAVAVATGDGASGSTRTAGRSARRRRGLGIRRSWCQVGAVAAAVLAVVAVVVATRTVSAVRDVPIALPTELAPPTDAASALLRAAEAAATPSGPVSRRGDYVLEILPEAKPPTRAPVLRRVAPGRQHLTVRTPCGWPGRPPMGGCRRSGASWLRSSRWPRSSTRPPRTPDATRG